MLSHFRALRQRTTSASDVGRWLPRVTEEELTGAFPTVEWLPGHAMEVDAGNEEGIRGLGRLLVAGSGCEASGGIASRPLGLADDGRDRPCP